VNGAVMTYFSKIIEAVKSIEGYNGKVTGIIGTPRTYWDVAGLTATDNQPLNPPPAIAKIPLYNTNQVSVTETQGTETAASRTNRVQIYAVRLSLDFL